MMQINTIPAIGFGTFGRTGKDGEAAILHALETGYRHLDTAQDYGTERTCGAALKASGLARDEVFVTTKIATGNFGEGELIPSLEKSREVLGIETLDLTLIHWPSPNGEIPLPVYMEQIAEARARGLTRLIGVSNFTTRLIDEARAIVGDGTLAANQVELHPYLQNRALADHCAAHGIAVTCYCPIAQGAVAGDPVLVQIGEKHGATASQVALAFLLARGLIVIPTSGRHERIDANFAARDITLDADDIARIEALDAGRRIIDPPWGPAWD